LKTFSPRDGFIVRIVQGNLLDQKTEAVVNAANEHLMNGGGVALAISIAAGAVFDRECVEWIRKRGPIKDGSTAITTAGKIKGAKKVIHVVGPKHSHGEKLSEAKVKKLERAMRSALSSADGCHLKSISVPAISTGIYNFPKEPAAKVLIETTVLYGIQNADSQLKEVRFVLLDNKDTRIFEEALWNATRSRQYDLISPIPVVSCNFDDVTDNSIEEIKKNSIVEIANSSNNKKNSNSSSSSVAAAEFAAAGVLLYRFQSGDLQVLLGEEYRTEGLVLNVLGGKRNDKESKSQDTASRELREESGYLISKADISYLISQSTTRLVYLGFAKYYLYCVQCPESLSDLDRRYNDLTKRPIECEMDRLHLIRWSYLVSAVKKATGK